MEVEAKVLHRLAQEQDNHYSCEYAPKNEPDDHLLFCLMTNDALHVHLAPIEPQNACPIEFDRDERCL